MKIMSQTNIYMRTTKKITNAYDLENYLCSKAKNQHFKKKFECGDWSYL